MEFPTDVGFRSEALPAGIKNCWAHPRAPSHRRRASCPLWADTSFWTSPIRSMTRRGRSATTMRDLPGACRLVGAHRHSGDWSGRCATCCGCRASSRQLDCGEACACS